MARNSIDASLDNGGAKKAGFPGTIGRGYMTSIWFHATGTGCGDLACTLQGRYKNVSPMAGIFLSSSTGAQLR